MKKMEKRLVSNQNGWNEKLHVEYVQIKVLLENMDTMLRKGFTVPHTETSVPKNDSVFELETQFPLDTPDHLREFSDAVKGNQEYKAFILNKFGKILGTDGMKKGDKTAPVLADIFFTKKLLSLTSWTGISRTRGLEKKISFQTFDGIICAFYDIIQNSDSRWTLIDNTAFFKDKLLKHANARSKQNESKAAEKLIANGDDIATLTTVNTDLADCDTENAPTFVDPRVDDNLQFAADMENLFTDDHVDQLINE